MRELTENMPETIFEIDSQGNIKFLNKAAIGTFGLFDINNQSKLNLYSFIQPEFLDLVRNDIIKLFRGEKTTPKTLWAKRTDGSSFPF